MDGPKKAAAWLEKAAGGISHKDQENQNVMVEKFVAIQNLADMCTSSKLMNSEGCSNARCSNYHYGIDSIVAEKKLPAGV